jgi:hypothetical protein
VSRFINPVGGKPSKAGKARGGKTARGVPDGLPAFLANKLPKAKGSKAPPKSHATPVPMKLAPGNTRKKP